MVNNRVRVMKKILLSAIALFALVFAGCNKSELDPVKDITYTHTIKASINDFGTKTTMYGNTVNWEEGDRIALFAEGTPTPVLYTLTEGAGTAEGVFGTNENTEGKVFVAALYPYNAAASFSEGNISTSVAKEYNWEKNRNNKAIMAAKITDPESVVFKNAGAVIALTVNNIPAGYNKIVLSSGAAVNGTANISFTDDVPVATMDATADENKSVTINFEKSVATSSKTFYFPVATTSEAVAFSVNLYKGSESTALISNKYTAAQRNNRYYKTINFDSKGDLPMEVSSSQQIKENMVNGKTNFILGQNTTEIEITEETVEELQITVGTTGEIFKITGSGAKGKVILCTPDNIKDLTIDLPNATVEVKPDAGVATFNRITATTAENTLVIPFGTTVENLIVNNGNVRVFGTVNSFISYKESGLVTIYKESGATIPQELDAAKFEVVDYSEDKFVKTKDALIAALASAADGAVVSLGCDIEGLTEILTIGKAITLDGHGHTITSTAGRAINVSGVAGSVTIKNLNIVAAGERAINIIQNSKNITIDNVKAAAANYCVNVAGSAPGVSITIKNSDLTGLNTVNIAGANTTVDITDTRLFCNDNNSSENYAAIAINPEVTGSKVTVKGGILVVNGESWGGSVADGSITFEDTKGNTNIKQVSFVINYGNNSYSFITFEEALAKHVNGETIIVTHDYVQPDKITIPADKEVILDLNGHTLSQEKVCTAHYEMIKNNGKLTVKDSKGNGKITFKDNGSGDSSFGWGSYTIANYKTLVVEGGTIENATTLNTNGAVHMYCAIHQGGGAESTTINGGLIKNDTYRSIRINNGKLVINGGKFEGQIWMHPFADNTSITIAGGNFAPRGVDGSSVYVENSSKNVVMSVSGGTFNTKIGCASPSKESVKGKITGGKFSESAKANTNAALFAPGNWSGLVDGFYTFTATSN